MFDNRLPPANPTAEMALLGALLANNKLLDRCGQLKPEHFAVNGLGAVFQHILDGVAAGRRVDGVSLRDRCSPDLIAALVAAMVAPETVPEYGRVIIECAQARALVDVANELLDTVYGGRVSDAPLIASKIDRIVEGSSSADRMISLDTAIAAVMADLDKDDPGGVATGFRCLDERLGRLEAGLVYVLAGRPGMGKSALAHGICLNAARDGIGVVEMALEMSAKQLARRALSAATGVRVRDIRPGSLSVGDANSLMRAQHGALKGLPLYIDDSSSQTPAMIAAKARTARRKHGMGLLMIDHLNLMRPDEADAKHGGTWAIGRASNTVLHIAKDCECPVILCVQLNRGPEGREDKRPNLADLRQSGDIEQDAYAVGFVYRQEVYLTKEPEQRDNERPETYAARVQDWHATRERARGRAEVIWGKLRDGEVGTDRLTFDGPTTSFGEERP